MILDLLFDIGLWYAWELPVHIEKIISQLFKIKDEKKRQKIAIKIGEFLISPIYLLGLIHQTYLNLKDKHKRFS